MSARFVEICEKTWAAGKRPACPVIRAIHGGAWLPYANHPQPYPDHLPIDGAKRCNTSGHLRKRYLTTHYFDMLDCQCTESESPSGCTVPVENHPPKAKAPVSRDLHRSRCSRNAKKPRSVFPESSPALNGRGRALPRRQPPCSWCAAAGWTPGRQALPDQSTCRRRLGPSWDHWPPRGCSARA